jgi:DNA-binding MarR family transcriptional regulator
MPKKVPINDPAADDKRFHPDVVAVADRLHSAAIHLLRRVRKQDVATEEAPAQLSALSVLVFGGPKTLGDLAAAEQVKPPTMSRIVAGLARRRLIEIAKDPGDARRMSIRATAKGTRLLQEGRQRRITYLASHLDRLTPEELGSLGEAVEILQKLLQEWH